MLWTKEYANNKTFTGIYNNSKNTDILIQTASAVLCIANDGSEKYTINKKGIITFDYNGNLVIYNETEYFVYDTDGTLIYNKPCFRQLYIQNRI